MSVKIQHEHFIFTRKFYAISYQIAFKENLREYNKCKLYL